MDPTLTLTLTPTVIQMVDRWEQLVPEWYSLRAVTRQYDAEVATAAALPVCGALHDGTSEALDSLSPSPSASKSVPSPETNESSNTTSKQESSEWRFRCRAEANKKNT